MSPILKATGVTKTYRTGAEEVVALRDVDLSVDAGQMVAVMGPSGSGKTTLLNCLSGLDDIDSGEVLIAGESIHEMRDATRTKHRAGAMGFVFQAFNLIPVFTATENVELPLLLAGEPARHARASARETLGRVGLGARLNHRPNELSGGEQQRVAIARALAGAPEIVWADEPTGNLDSETAAHVLELIRELHEGGMTVVLVTHDETVAAMAQRRVHMRDGQIVDDKPAAARRRALPRKRTTSGSRTTAATRLAADTTVAAAGRPSRRQAQAGSERPSGPVKQRKPTKRARASQ